MRPSIRNLIHGPFPVGLYSAAVQEEHAREKRAILAKIRAEACDCRRCRQAGSSQALPSDRDGDPAWMWERRGSDLYIVRRPKGMRALAGKRTRWRWALRHRRTRGKPTG